MRVFVFQKNWIGRRYSLTDNHGSAAGLSSKFTQCTFEFSHNTQSWQHWHLIQVHQKYSRKEKEVIFSQKPNKNIYTRLFGGKWYLLYTIHKDFQKKITSFSFFKYFDAFELDVNVVNFVYYGKTRLTDPRGRHECTAPSGIQILSFSCSFRKKNLQNSRLARPLWELPPPPPQENRGSTTGIFPYLNIQVSQNWAFLGLA